ncbi:hypothetical protein SODALDRAFT_273577 [Sodiomyces alkalinus F11]|uniref:Glycosyltransferase 2-like domain-containing protein n=1 Tax=Sodiomyces alkalinus (strain CBS 110278 / VKM F-3762 / F11) TaxID=1314773 RepID=A0A3N2PZD5_SODAK|nr:hypothetical protein SODALDRAFT_273577 [Sodiomyces alkalinus F11]ROT39788.1 hypothetical protein SODALDRAFT_273577 [Sodiomyces alkalinus F11]
MSLLLWCSRRAPGLAMIALVMLCYWVISRELAASRYNFEYSQQTGVAVTANGSPDKGAGFLTALFAYYSLFVHALMCLFPARSCWAIFDLTRTLRKTARSRILRDFKSLHRRRGSSTSLSSAETLTSSHACSASSSEAGDIDLQPYPEASEEAATAVIHAIVIPNYKEEVDTLRETLDVLASHPQATASYDVYLAMESREPNVQVKAGNLVQLYAKKFRSINYTVHPADIPGESAGKGSNMAWAARKASERYSMEVRKDVVITGIDADSHLSSNYTALIATMHFAYPETAMTTMYSAPIIFDRNAHGVPAIVRVADIFWGAAGLSGLYNGSTIAPPTSVYSVPLQLVDRVGGWDCDAEAIGEDLHMFLKCFFALNGNLTCRVLPSPVSQSNVAASGKGLRGLYAGMQARYKQALRHMWGALDTGYSIRKFVELWQERKHTSRAFRPLHTSLGDASDVYVPESQMDERNPEQARESGIFSDVTHDTLPSPHWERIFYLGHRLYEAHFLPVQMAILVISSTLYVWVAEGNGDPNNIAWAFTAANVLRTVSFMEVACILFLYERYHDVAVKNRHREMTEAGLADRLDFSYRGVKKNFIDYIMVPVVAPLYGSIPCAHAQLSHLWTIDLVYTVSMKATRQRAKSVSVEEMA